MVAEIQNPKIEIRNKETENRNAEFEARDSERGARNAALHLSERWDNFRALCRVQLGEDKNRTLPELPALTPDQRRPMNHRFFARSGGGAAGTGR